MDRESELALVERVRAGDTTAFDAIHAAFNTRLYGFLARLAHRRDVAEDLLEETWLRFVTHADQLRADTRLGPWLFTVARNVHVTWCRARAVESRAAATLSLWPTPITVDPRSSGRPAANSSVASRLPWPAFRWRRGRSCCSSAVEGLTPSEAAAVCGVTPRGDAAAPQASARVARAASRRAGAATGHAPAGGGTMTFDEKPDAAAWRPRRHWPRHRPPPARDARIRARCHEVMTRRPPARASWPARLALWLRVFRPASHRSSTRCWLQPSACTGSSWSPRRSRRQGSSKRSIRGRPRRPAPATDGRRRLTATWTATLAMKW